MEADTDYDGIGVGPNPEPTPGKCPSCNEEMNVSKRINEGTDSIITSFEYECPNGCLTLLDKP